jgi:hypothetical protein
MNNSKQMVTFSKTPDKEVLVSVYDLEVKNDYSVPLYCGKMSKKRFMDWLRDNESTECGLELENDVAFGPIIRDM